MSDAKGLSVALRAGLDWGGSSSRMPTDFLCFAKESQQRKATRDARPSAACGDGGPLRFSKVRAATEWRVGCAAA
jgi:hypothetical protein